MLQEKPKEYPLLRLNPQNSNLVIGYSVTHDLGFLRAILWRLGGWYRG